MSAAPADPAALPIYTAADFSLKRRAPECDMIMKGGIASGIVYPYAIMEIATKYRFRSIGGTSAGAIAAAFAAAAEYGRRGGDPEAYVRLQTHCRQLPELMPHLFQPSPGFRRLWDMAQELRKAPDKKAAAWGVVRSTLGWAIVGAVAGSVLTLLLCLATGQRGAVTTLAAVLALILCGIAMLAVLGRRAWQRYLTPAIDAWQHLPEANFGLCPGTQQAGHDHPGLTDWLHEAIQDIAFGNKHHPKPLTFGDLEADTEGKPPILLRMITTNLSMRRPHTLPHLGITAGFRAEEWASLFPAGVMAWLTGPTARRWNGGNEVGALLLPEAADLPVLVGVRMSLSFPGLFAAVPLYTRDFELPSIVRQLGGKPEPRIHKILMSDGGISSNFPVHLFDSPLPKRPTFAISLEELLWDPAEVVRRAIIPATASEGQGVQIKTIETPADFGWQILNSAKDWQDQMLAGIPGQRERIARIFLTPGEGGGNIDMPPETSRRLMAYGLDAGRAFTTQFNFNEHKWRRSLMLFQTHCQFSNGLRQTFDADFARWHAAYGMKAKKSYNINQGQARFINDYFSAARTFAEQVIPDGPPTIPKAPRAKAMLRIIPDYEGGARRGEAAAAESAVAPGADAKA